MGLTDAEFRIMQEEKAAKLAAAAVVTETPETVEVPVVDQTAE